FQALLELQGKLEGCGIGCRDVRAQRAFHSALIEPSLEPLRQAASGISHKPPRIGFVSDESGAFVTAAPDAAYWIRHARGPVRFAEGIRTLLAAGITHFVEIGPDAVLSRLGPAAAT